MTMQAPGWWLALLLAGALGPVGGGCGGGGGGNRDGGQNGHDGALDASSACTTNAQCDDGIDCTDDTCSASGQCLHTLVPARCSAGKWCNPTKGCEAGKACATDDDCKSTDPCVVNNGCDPASRVCKWAPLDGDGDGQAPLICGGTDCDDSDPGVYAGAPEACNGKDDDCDGVVDNHGAEGSCGVGFECQAGGLCVCPTGTTQCEAGCFDLATNHDNCGGCGIACGVAATCVGSACQCPPGQTDCQDSGCVDIRTDPNNCGGCWYACGGGGTCVASACQCASTSCPADMVGTRCDGYIDRYEASQGAGGKAVSVAGAVPWVNVTQAEAQAACTAAGKRLCTLYEWGTGCAGPPPYRKYPYGNTYDRQACNGSDRGLGAAVPTGSIASCEGAYPGLFDMNGNVWEWTTECYGGSFCTAMGGSFDSNDPQHFDLRCDVFGLGDFDPATRASDLGFRCCQSR